MKTHSAKETGEIMLESMIIVLLSVFVLVWLLGLGFLYYQRYLTTVATNDAAAKVAATYNNVTSDVVMGYVTTEDLSNRNLYRAITDYSSSSSNVVINQERARSYIEYKLKTSNFVGMVDNVEVELQLVKDSLVRRHIEITSKCKFRGPFAKAFEYFGFSELYTFSVTATSECADFADYASTVQFLRSTLDFAHLDNAGFISKVVKFIGSCVKLYNHLD